MSPKQIISRIISCLLGWPALLVPAAGQAIAPEVVTYGAFETREYSAQNGRQIRVTSLGNLTGFESPFGFEHINNGKRAREGYVLSYDNPATGQTRVLYDVHDSYSRDHAGGRDFVPYSFRGPAAGSTFPINTLVTATVIVDTRDGLIRLTHQFEWRAGLGRVKILTTVANRHSRAVVLRSFKRHADIDLDGAGSGPANMSDWLRVDDGIVASIRCNCAPPAPPSPLTEQRPLHVLSFTGSPAPPYKMIKNVANNSELFSSGPVAVSDLLGARRNENNQATLAWLGSVLGPGGSQSFMAQYQQE